VGSRANTGKKPRDLKLIAGSKHVRRGGDRRTQKNTRGDFRRKRKRFPKPSRRGPCYISLTQTLCGVQLKVRGRKGKAEEEAGPSAKEG